MVLESLISPQSAEKKPFEMFFLGLLYSSIAMFLSLWIFREQVSLVMIFLTVIACTPLMYRTMIYEEQKDLKLVKERILIKSHSKALLFFMFLFLGFLLSFTLWYVFLPEETVYSSFNTQIQTIQAINSKVAFAFASSTADAALTSSTTSNSVLLTQIIANNLKVLLFCIFFAFFYGAGAIFILTWNASVIGAAAGSFIRSNLSIYATQVGLIKVGGYLHIFSLGLLKYLTHGIPEIAAYFVGGLAGGIISVAVIRHDFGSKEFKHILFDSLDLVILAIIFLSIAAFIEVFITPALF